jgi:hypothetical protein
MFRVTVKHTMFDLQAVLLMCWMNYLDQDARVWMTAPPQFAPFYDPCALDTSLLLADHSLT